MNEPKGNDPMSDRNAPAAGGMAGGRSESGDYFAALLGSAMSGRLQFVCGASNVAVRADPSMEDLYRARFEGQVPTVRAREGTVTIEYPRSPLFDWLYYLRERPDEVALNAQVPWDIEVRGGVSKLTADLRGLKLGSLNLGGGASRVELALPKPSGTVSVRVSGGANYVTIHRPEGVAARTHVGGGSTNLTFDDRRFGAVGGEVDLRSPDYDGAIDRYDIAVMGGANSLTVDTR